VNKQITFYYRYC